MNTEIVYYATLLAIITASIPLAAWLKREGDKAWREHQRRAAMKRLTATISASTAGFTAAMAKASRAAIDMEAAMGRLAAAITTGPARCGDDTCTEEHGR